jgi:hypothetical protein
VSWKPPDPWSYALLLSWYLGDGCVSPTHRSFQLIITCDSAYPEIIVDCSVAVQIVARGRAAYLRQHRVHNCVRIECTWKRWPEVFPQRRPARRARVAEVLSAVG